MNNNYQPEVNGFYKLNWAQRIGFGSGDLAQNLIFQTVATYLMLYLTTVLKINPAFVGGLILTVRLIDCFWSPVVGKFIDNRNPKLGKYRAYLLYGGIPLTVAACLLMLPQAATWSMTMKMIYATVSYTVLSMIYSVVNIPYGSIMASMTRDNDEVLILTSTRMVCANIGQIVVQAGFPIGLAMFLHQAVNWDQAIFMAIGTLPAFIILPSLPMLKRILGKKGLYYTLLSIGFIGFAILFFIGKFGDVQESATIVKVGGNHRFGIPHRQPSRRYCQRPRRCSIQGRILNSRMDYSFSNGTYRIRPCKRRICIAHRSNGLVYSYLYFCHRWFYSFDPLFLGQQRKHHHYT